MMKIMKFLKNLKDSILYEEFLRIEHNHSLRFHSTFILYRNKIKTKRKLKIISDNLSESKKTYLFSVVNSWKFGYYDDYHIEKFKQFYDDSRTKIR